MHRLAPYLCVLFSCWLCCCSSKPGSGRPKANDRFSNAGSVDQAAGTAIPAEFSASYYCQSPSSDPRDTAGQALIGRWVPDLEDSTILSLVYGRCADGGGGHAYNWGPTMWDESDSVYVEVAERLESGALKIIYLRGELSISETMHNHFIESAVLLVPDRQGWRVVDAYKDATTIDFAAVELVGNYFERMLVRYVTEGMYAGGVEFASMEYRLLAPGYLRGPALSFISRRSNTASDQCLPNADEPDFHCDCYEGQGHVSLELDRKWKALRFTYSLETQNGDCEMADAQTSVAHQTWLMGRDTALQIKGDALSEWGEDVVGTVNLTDAEIEAALHRPRKHR